MEIKKIATIYNDYTEKFGIPRQSGLVSGVKSRIVFDKPYRVREALKGLEGFSHIWLIWEFSEATGTGFRPTVRPPRLGGNTRMGVFATRSPFRPNSLGLTVVRLEEIQDTEQEGTVLIVSGADLMSGTPIYDIKPYLPYVDSIPDAIGGFTEQTREYRIPVTVTETAAEEAKRLGYSDQWLQTVCELLSQDPRPAYREDGERVYGMQFGNAELRFQIRDGRLLLQTVLPADGTGRNRNCSEV